MQPPLIIGGGPAGAAAAALLAAAGRQVRLIERNAEPTDKVCGDFLSSGAIAALDALDVDPRGLGGAPVTTLRLVWRHHVAETRLPFTALGLTRRALDEALLQRAVRNGAEVMRGHAVRRLEATAAGFTVHAGALGALTTPTVFLATGKHDLRGTPRPHRTGAPLGLKMYYRLAPEQRRMLRYCIELVMFPGGYAGLQLVEHDRAVLCMVVAADRFRRAGGHWHGMLHHIAPQAPHLASRLRGATPCLARPLAIAGIPYGHLHQPAQADPGLFRLGDQACVIPSFAGDGIAIALASGVLAATTWLGGGDATEYHRQLARRLRAPLRLAALIHHGCVTPVLQPIMAAAGRAWPGGMRRLAATIRIAAA